MTRWSWEQPASAELARLERRGYGITTADRLESAARRARRRDNMWSVVMGGAAALPFAYTVWSYSGR